MKKNTARIMIAVLSLIMAIGIATGSTFAWFSMNNKVLVTGMTVTTKVNNNLLIAETNAEANYQIALNQTRAGTLEPVSTINGVNFFWTSTTNVDASGDAKTDVYNPYNEDTSLAYAAANKTNYDNEFNTNYGFDAPAATYKGVAYGYIDYAFYLKGTNADAAAGKIYMSKCNLLYNGATPPTDKAYRVAVFAKESAKDTTTSDEVAVENLVTILNPHDASYLNTARYNVETGATGTTSGTDGLYEYITGELYGDNAAQGSVTKWYTTNDLSTAKDVTALVTASAEASAKITGKKQAVNGASTLNTVSNLGEKAIISDSIASGTTVYYKVTVRLWLEGEDNTCNNDTFADLTGDWTLDLEFKLDGSYDSAVDEIGGTAVATLAKSTVTGTAGLSVGDETAASYAFYKADGTAIANGAEFGVASNVITNLHASAEKVYCIITTAKGNTYRTPTVTLDTNSFTLTQTLTNVTSSTAADSVNADFSATYTANDGYTLPTAITVTVGGNALTVGTDYTWNNTTGALTISGSKITGAVVITITGDAE